MAVRQGAWKLVSVTNGKGGKLKALTADATPELYDLATDLGETKNLAASHPEK